MKRFNRSSQLSVTWPSFTWLVIFFLIPSAFVFLIAFKPHDIYGGITEGWTLESFYTLLNSYYFTIFWRTLWLSIVTALISLSLALPVGYYIARSSPRTRQYFLLLVVVPFWSSFLVRIFAWKTLLHPEGVLKQFLATLHIIGPDTSLLYQSGTVLLVMVYCYLPFAVLPIFSAATKFNFHLSEAAKDLGATRFQAFYKIFIPGIRRGIITAFLMVFIPALGAYVIPDVVGGTQSEMVGNKIAQRVFVERNLPEASMLSSMLSLVVFIPIAIIALIHSRSSRSEKYSVAARGKQ